MRYGTAPAPSTCSPSANDRHGDGVGADQSGRPMPRVLELARHADVQGAVLLGPGKADDALHGSAAPHAERRAARYYCMQ